MHEVISNYYPDSVQCIEWWASDGHHEELADYGSDPLQLLILAEEEEAED